LSAEFAVFATPAASSTDNGAEVYFVSAEFFSDKIGSLTQLFKVAGFKKRKVIISGQTPSV